MATAAAGFATALSFKSARMRCAPSLAAPVVLSTNASLVSIASVHTSSLKRENVPGERRRAKSLANLALACSVSRSSASRSVFLIGCLIGSGGQCLPVPFLISGWHRCLHVPETLLVFGLFAPEL